MAIPDFAKKTQIVSKFTIDTYNISKYTNNDSDKWKLSDMKNTKFSSLAGLRFRLGWAHAARGLGTRERAAGVAHDRRDVAW